jgi:hypothetical protein
MDFTTVPNLSWEALLPAPFHAGAPGVPPAVVLVVLEHAASEIDNETASAQATARDLLFMTEPFVGPEK